MFLAPFVSVSQALLAYKKANDVVEAYDAVEKAKAEDVGPIRAPGPEMAKMMAVKTTVEDAHKRTTEAEGALWATGQALDEAAWALENARVAEIEALNAKTEAVRAGNVIKQKKLDDLRALKAEKLTSKKQKRDDAYAEYCASMGKSVVVVESSAKETSPEETKALKKAAKKKERADAYAEYCSTIGKYAKYCKQVEAEKKDESESEED